MTKQEMDATPGGEAAEPIVMHGSRRTYRVSFVASASVSLRRAAGEHHHVVVDARVAALWPELLAPFRPEQVIQVDATESTKSLEGVESILTSLTTVGISRSATIIVIGGGVTQDAASFAASILYRGLDWVFYPTTLLSQADSCIGSKTSINFRAAKNQLGGFHPPAEVVIASDVRTTLPMVDIASGIGEIAHYLLVSGEQDFQLLESASEWNESTLTELVRRSLAIKKTYVERDEFDTGERLILNFGHTFGHALEAATMHRLPHGLAVAFGIDIANVFACRRGLLAPRTRDRVRMTLESVWRGQSLFGVSVDGVVEALRRDKKGDREVAQPILMRDIGDMMQVPVSIDNELRPLIEEYLSSSLYAQPLTRGGEKQP